MQYFSDIMLDMTSIAQNIFSNLSTQAADDIAEEIKNQRQVFVTAMGRSALTAKLMAVRLIQAGITVHIIGDPTTPAITENELLIIFSGSGETKSLVLYSEQAKKVGAKQALITASANSHLSNNSCYKLLIPIQEIKEIKHWDYMAKSSIFEYVSFWVGDLIAAKTAKLLQQSINDMHKKHANLE